MPEIDSTLVGFCIEVLFRFIEPDGTSYLDWCHGTVVAIHSVSARKIKIKWDEECLQPGDPTHTVDKLLKLQWNPAVAKKGA
mmetsp:Transcript_7324/g.15055  ORF Transcript_7324/g.15055 Transcript_7324/m.15055 type:complete len:82 (+) Transcript_7324:1036-1281(+)